jgi:hypothetical protein
MEYLIGFLMTILGVTMAILTIENIFTLETMTPYVQTVGGMPIGSLFLISLQIAGLGLVIGLAVMLIGIYMLLQWAKK